MTGNDTWFLLVRYPRTGTTEVQTFDDALVAAQAYSETEAHLECGREEADAVLVGAPSREVVEERYPSYFLHATSVRAKIEHLLGSMPALPA
ncbi:hypothetical protein ABZ805_25155 [Saccharopolyspora sp. NPDC047091]|uniref:hypothetical protein n=1 Tax=Saccharopolyspora sp. NPDC047091 TaxID=3155924 RepID=UPI0033F9C01E